ncbi:MAG: hypothetical protein M3R45_12035 [Pseudomonadota bacterium]|nr:hypothetical protein [Pseudomonadota bacterium]
MLVSQFFVVEFFGQAIPAIVLPGATQSFSGFENSRNVLGLKLLKSEI